jgi:UDP-N-acetylmuramyl pentapeptide synthase
MIYSISKISEIIDAQFVGKEDCEIEYLLIDSRNIISSFRTMFFAIKGERHDGHQFIEELYKKGIRSFVVEETPQNLTSFPEANFLIVKNTLKALQDLAANHRKNFNYPVVGITGSNGKTIIKEWLFNVLQGEKKVVRSPKSFNSQVGVPLSIWLMNESYNLAIFEAGISLPNEMENLEQIIQPNIGLISNIGDPHQENFKDLDEKVEEKLKLFKDSDIIVYSADHEIIDQKIKLDKDLSKKKRITWSENKSANLQIVSKTIENNKTRIRFKIKNSEGEILIPFIDTASVEDAIHVMALLVAMDLNPGYYQGKFETLPSVAMRMEQKKRNK